MDSLGWDYGLGSEDAASDGSDDNQGTGHDAYDLAALNLAVLLDAIRREDLAAGWHRKSQ